MKAPCLFAAAAFATAAAFAQGGPAPATLTLASEYQGQGYATDAVNAVTKPYASSIYHLNEEESVFEFETAHPRLSSMPT
ncbi:MAG: hypothetical protein ILM98_09910 [Kiritimatiellae bacterium]|nr:hypothetical protein [Kiritimatiellia bacterium]